MKYSGADWIARQGKPMSEFGMLVADILGQLYQGIYHIGSSAKRVDWSDDAHIEINLPCHDFATYDHDRLTALVVLCHDHAVRLILRPSGPALVKLQFNKRQRGGKCWERHPAMEDAMVHIHEKYGFTPTKTEA